MNLPRKTRLQDLDGKKEGIARADPARVIGREPARRNDTVNMGVQQQVLPPGVQDAENADLGSEVFGVGCDFQQGLRAGGEQQVVKQAGFSSASTFSSWGTVNTTWK